jgi:hypothetical protein
MVVIEIIIILKTKHWISKELGHFKKIMFIQKWLKKTKNVMYLDKYNKLL